MPPTNIPYTVSSLSHLFASMLNEPAPQKQGMSFVDARYVSQTVAAMPKNVIAAFCWDGMLAHYIVHCVCVWGGGGGTKILHVQCNPRNSTFRSLLYSTREHY